MSNKTLKTKTQFPELNEVLRELVGSVRKILGDNLVGAYLQGSFALGDFDEHSDCDFIMAIDRELTDEEVGALQAMHERIYDLGPEWGKHLEGSYFPTALLRDYRLCGSDLWYVDNGGRVLERSNHCNKIVVRWILREKGVVLIGPEPSTLVDPIPTEVLRRAILESINQSGRLVLESPEEYSNRFYQGYIVLNWCRKLHDLHTGRCGSKRAGAEWAKQNLDQKWSGLIDRSWACRPDPARSVREPADRADYERTLQFVREVIDAANRYSADAGLLQK